VASWRRLDLLQNENRTYPWSRVVWLTGVDYFSSLAYQPGIALIAAGILAPTATLILVAVTVLGALPVYAQVAQRSYVGQGSIAMLENLFHGWSSKLVVLVLIGFAATDFVITMTISAADAARHAIANPYLQPYLALSDLQPPISSSHAHMLLTIGLLALLAVVFLVGFHEAIQLAALVAIPYLLLNFIVFLAGLVDILRHPDLITRWQLTLTTTTDWTGVFVASALVFPRLALGLSGFETGVSVMPLISGEREGDGQTASAADEALEEQPLHAPRGRIRNTRKLLALAAGLMGSLLILSSFTSTLLIPPSAYRVGGPASGRAPAYLAHQLLGDVFGTVYDLSTIVIL
jgi:hypothetical protein